MGSFLCKIGVHKWIHKRNPDGEPYLECERCQKQQDAVSIADEPGSDSRRRALRAPCACGAARLSARHGPT